VADVSVLLPLKNFEGRSKLAEDVKNCLISI
jgi:hypothetical protein